MIATRKATMEGYNKTVWFSARAITNISALRNLIDQYHVTYDSDDLIFVVHRESESKPNMEFKMHKRGLHYYDPRKVHHMTFVNTVSKNKTGLTKRQIKCAEIARNLYKTLSYRSMKDFKWVIRSNQIKDCPVTIQYIDVATKIWGKNIAAMKGKTTSEKVVLNYSHSRNPSCARTDARTNPSAQRATQIWSLLARVYSVSRQDPNTTTVP
jgi:hypothetical protein